MGLQGLEQVRGRTLAPMARGGYPQNFGRLFGSKRPRLGGMPLPCRAQGPRPRRLPARRNRSPVGRALQQRLAQKLTLAPENLVARMEQLLSAPPREGFDALHALEAEVLALVATHMPEVDLASVHRRHLACRASR